jgi:hypothetical protein
MTDLVLFAHLLFKAGMMTGILPGMGIAFLLRRFRVVACGFEYEQNQRTDGSRIAGRVQRRDGDSGGGAIRRSVSRNCPTIISHAGADSALQVWRTRHASGLVLGAIFFERGASESHAQDASQTQISDPRTHSMEVSRRGLVGILAGVWTRRQTLARTAPSNSANRTQLRIVFDRQVSGDGQLAKIADFNSSELNVRATSPSRKREIA